METDRNVRIDPHSLYEIEKRRAGCRFPFFCYCLSFGGEGEGLVPLHWHNDMEIFYTEAAGILYVNDRTCPVEPGDIAFINPGELHRTSRLSAGDMVHIVFDLSLLRTPDPHGGINEVIDDLAARKTRIRTRAERGTPLYEKLLPLIGRLTEYVEAPVPFGRESCRIQSALYALFSVFFEEDCFEEADESALYGVRHRGQLPESPDRRRSRGARQSFGDLYLSAFPELRLGDSGQLHQFRPHPGGLPPSGGGAQRDGDGGGGGLHQRQLLHPSVPGGHRADAASMAEKQETPRVRAEKRRV